MNNFKPVLLLIVTPFFIIASSKQYACTCHSVITNQDTIIEVIKTTKLGSKGFSKTCIDHKKTNTNLKACRLQ
jgi:hypothetical protein